MRRFALCFLLVAFASGALVSQAAEPSATAPEPYKASEFPAWARDLRRFEIISIGVLPFGVFYSAVAFDLCRYLGGKSIGFAFSALGTSNPFVVTNVAAFDIAYAPWPVKSATSYVTSSDEKALILISAVTLSLLVGLADFIILKVQERAELRRRVTIESRPSLPESEEPPVQRETDTGGPDPGSGDDTAQPGAVQP